MGKSGDKGYQIVPFPWLRVPIVDSLHAARDKTMMHALLEVDVTEAREQLLAHKRRTGESLSFTAFIIGCVARAVEEHKEMQAFRRGTRDLIVFNDVDVCTPIEHHVNGVAQSAPHVIRAANCKPFEAIHREIRAAQVAGIGNPVALRGRRLYPYLPHVLRAAFWRAFERFPRLEHSIAGTVMVTAVGMFGKGTAWGISPVSEYSLQVIVGSIAEKPGVVDGQAAVRQYLCLTVSADHDVVDGAPMARYIARLKELIEGCYGLHLEKPSSGETHSPDAGSEMLAYPTLAANSAEVAASQLS